jgi:predicted enzyme related to lactoylglutathione lyase
MKTNPLGRITWMDLTVKNATEVSAFYQAVAGWKSVGVAMGG